MTQTHPNVPHPREHLPARELTRAAAWNDALLTWLTDHVLASTAMFDVALVLPLLVLPMPDSVKITLGVFSGSWIQWWALPALQRSQQKADVKRDAKADADHQALTHLATTLDEVAGQVGELHDFHIHMKLPQRELRPDNTGPDQRI